MDKKDLLPIGTEVVMTKRVDGHIFEGVAVIRGYYPHEWVDNYQYAIDFGNPQPGLHTCSGMKNDSGERIPSLPGRTGYWVGHKQVEVVAHEEAEPIMPWWENPHG